MIFNLYKKLVLNEEKGFVNALLLFLLWILSLMFSAVVGLKNFLYDANILKGVKLNSKVISVGNITVGGTGKTQFVRYLAKYLQERGKSTSVICRSYSGSESEAWVSDGNRVFLNVMQSGDEAFMLAHFLPGIPVGVSKKRISLAKTIKNNDAIILDDGFQYRKFRRDLDIVLIDASSGIKERFLLPRGVLREGFKSLKRADVIIIMRENHMEEEAKKNVVKLIRSYNSQSEILLAREKIISFSTLNRKKSFVPDEFNIREGSVFTALGNPGAFVKNLERYGIVIKDAIVFQDHYFFKKEDLRSLKPQMQYFITHKDAVKLERIIEPEASSKFWVVDVSLILFDETRRETICPKKIEQLFI
ncbi:MAG: tetraacyldisaccharide 4'-kinase [bacterium]